MTELFQKSLQHRLLAAFLLMGIVPYLVIMLYFTYWGRTNIISRQGAHYQQQAEQSKQLIQSRIEQLEREMLFLSQLEIFDDMIATDIDYRISRLLEQKAEIGEAAPMRLYAIDTDAKIIATSYPQMLHKPYGSTLQNKNGHYIDQKSLIITLPLHASFDKRALGYLVVHYPLENLRRFMLSEDASHYMLASKDQLILGERLDETQQTHSLSLEKALEGYTLSYAVNETEVLAFINRFMRYLTLALFIGVALIYIVSRRLTRQIIHPIAALTNAAETIISTQNFDLRVQSNGIDEIGSLAVMFNRLVETTGEALATLATENQLRMQRFIDLTTMFNHITQIDDERTCIDVSVEKLRSVVPYPMRVASPADATAQHCISIPLHITDFNTQQCALYGRLIIEKEAFDDELEEHFFISVAAMIMLQIERISLINKIRSASAAKSAFISGMSHELRTPLNAIIGFSQYLIAYETMSDDQIDTVSKIEKASIHLLSIINDILDIAKIEAGKMKISPADVTMKPLLQECAEIISPLADEKGLTLDIELDEIDQLVLHTDAKLCKQIIINLLSNAVKFTHEGGVTIRAVQNENRLIVSIIDTGIGIEEKDLLKVFDAFTQLKNAKTSHHKGTGLGLSLSRHIAQSLGAELNLHSEGRERGTTATVIFNL